MKYLVLGSEGQIGKPLTEMLRSRGHEVIEYDIERNAAEDLRNTRYDLMASHHFEKVINECDFVYFLAFDVGGSRYLEKYQKTFNFINNNVQLMANTFFYLEKTKKPFIYASSQMSMMLHSVYGNCKLIGDKYTDILGGIKVLLWNVYGVEKNEEKAHVISDFIHKARTDGNIQMLTTGLEKRQFLHVEDCCEALDTIMCKYSEFTSDNNLHITSGKSQGFLMIT